MYIPQIATPKQTDLPLVIPNLNKEFILDTDGMAIAGILQQADKNNDVRVVAYASRSLQRNERKWHIGEQEALAIVWCVEYFREYLLTAPHTIVHTDHNNLRWIDVVVDIK